MNVSWMFEVLATPSFVICRVLLLVSPVFLALSLINSMRVDVRGARIFGMLFLAAFFAGITVTTAVWMGPGREVALVVTGSEFRVEARQDRTYVLLENEEGRQYERVIPGGDRTCYPVGATVRAETDAWGRLRSVETRPCAVGTERSCS